jgi:hypothetical protein
MQNDVCTRIFNESLCSYLHSCEVSWKPSATLEKKEKEMKEGRKKRKKKGWRAGDVAHW